MSKRRVMSSARKNRSKKKEKTEDEEISEKEPKGSYAWKLFLPSQIRTLINCATPEELEEKMAMTLNMDQYEVDLKEGAQVDYFVVAFHWAKEKSFDERQLGGFLALLSGVLENIRENRMPKQENMKFLKDSFVGVGLDNPDQIPISLYFFNLEHAKDIMEYIVSTVFRHYSLYEYLFTQEQDELIIGTDILTHVCPEIEGPIPPPLEEGMTLETYEKFLLKKGEDLDTDNDEQVETKMSEDLTDAVLKAVETSESEAVKNVTAEELRRVIEKVTKEMIVPTKKELREKIKEKELAYLSRIGKVQVK